MAYYYDRFDGGTNAGAVLWVGDAGYSGNGMTVSWEGGWHSFAGSWYVNYIYNSIGRDAGAGEVRRDYVDDGSVSGSGDKWFTSYTETFPRYSYNYNVTLYSYVRASVNGATREAQAEYTFTVPAIPPAFNTLNATRVSDNQVNLSWTAASGNISAVCIERSVDGGSFSEVAVIWSASATSWQDTATTADHSYTYRARYHHEGAYGAYSNMVTVTMTPSAPQTITTAAIQGSTNVAVELGNASPVATSLEWQASTDGGQTWGASSTVSGSPVTSFTATGISGTAYIRVRNVNATGTSDWLVSEQVTTICPPAAPTLISPTGVLDMSGGSVTFEWRHNPLDGSSQTAAQLAYSTNGGSTWTTVTKSTEESHTISPIPWAVGTTVTWRVRTKGADASYGEWSQTRTFNVYTAPTLSITSPSATITGMPISLTATYSDMAGYSCQAATASLTKDGRTLYSESATINGTSITSSLDVSEFLPDNGESYTVVLTARSSSGLSTSANATFTVDFVEPQAGELNISNDPETGYASLLATFDNSASEITYTGSTNAQYESSEGYVRSLTVEGKSEKWNQGVKYNATTSRFTVDSNKFGAGNEPSTGAEFKATDVYKAKLAAGELYDYDAGSLVSIEGVEVRGRNLLDLTSYTWHQASAVAYEVLSASSLKVAPSSSSATWCNYRMGWSELLEVGKTYTLTCKYSGNVHNFPFGIGIHNPAAGSYIVSPANNYQTGESGSFTVTFTAQIEELRIWWYVNYSSSNGQTPAYVTIYDVMLEVGSTAHAYEPYSLTTIETPLRSAGSVHDTLMADADSWTVERRVGVRSYQSGDESDPDVLTDGATTYYALSTPTQDPETSIDTIEIGSAFTVATDLDSTFDMTTWDGSADAVSVSVSRVNPDGTITPLLTDGASGSGIVDRYAPLNVTYQYAVSTKASSQAAKTVYVDNIIESDLWFAYWGENVAKAKWNPDNGGIQVTRPQKTRVYYAGRRDPVSYDGHAVALTETPSWMFICKDEVDVFVKLIEDGGRGVYKSCDGWVYHADFDLTMTPSYTAIGYYGGASLGITRIAGEKL